MRPRSPAILVIVVLAAAAPARADDRLPGYAVDRTVDGPVIVGALAGALLPSLVPTRVPPPADGRPTSELFAFDEGVHANYSPRAARLADAGAAVSLAAPLAYLTTATGRGAIDDAAGDRLTLYTETIALDLALVQLVKHVVQRPRPYTHNPDPSARAHARAAGDDAAYSFYSSHAALAFGAATSGAYLLGASGADARARGAAWGLGFATAAFTANLRVRAGEHYYTDVIVGALAGIAIGYGVPAAHASAGAPAAMTGSDVALALGGVVVGAIASEVVPLGRGGEVREGHGVVLAPMIPRGGGGGISLSGVMR